ncbi:MAG: hypothetical protein WBW79_08020, partial [Desulfocapsaceae bacterium]
DILYDGPRNPGWPDDDTPVARAKFLEESTGGGLKKAVVLNTLKEQYVMLAAAEKYKQIVLWFDACLFDQSMLVHILTCMHHKGIKKAELLCVDVFPGIEPYNGLGQLQPSQMASVYDQREQVTNEQFQYAKIVDEAFANQNKKLFSELSKMTDAPLPWIPAAVTRWLQEQPDAETGLGRLETLALEAIRSGCEKPWDIFNKVAATDTPPQYWGDITLWAKINGLADRNPPLVRIEGPLPRLPQWEGIAELKSFRIEA